MYIVTSKWQKTFVYKYFYKHTIIFLYGLTKIIENIHTYNHHEASHYIPIVHMKYTIWIFKIQTHTQVKISLTL